MDPTNAVDDDDDLDHLLRPARRPPLVHVALGRLRRVDRRVLVAGGIAVLLAIVVLVAMGWRSRPATVSLPRASVPSGPAAAPAAGGLAPTSTTGGMVVVHVAGAVARPGLVTLPAGARIADALDAAGGAVAAADRERGNQAALVADGVRVYVPSVGQTDVPAAVGTSGSAAPASGGAPAGEVPAPVDLNSATEVELDTLPGVGPATAAAILAHRDEHGPFATVDALDEVPGIGPAKLAQLRDLVTAG